MPFKYAYIFPILCPVWFYATFIITYIISVYKKDVTAIFPYISDTGNWSPESCIFGFMLNVGSIIVAVTMYIRYRQVKHVLSKETSLAETIKKKNFTALIIGIFAVFGVCIVGNFQESNALAVHLLGATLAFGFGSIYQSIQTWISFQLYPTVGNKKINIIRVLCVVVSSITFIVTSVCGALAFISFTGNDITKWTKEDGGFDLHFISVITEWILAITTMLFLCLYTPEFKSLSLSEPPLTETTRSA